uniref:ESF1 RRM domain-containing protein n=1 Tax=Pseudo-nitzschia australis TaxID=44445 RepID=A0A7S4ELK0_9STRA|mmetsp:Transcript_24393/g.53416  ORF Transcript_24393/g.53416 Transcript_24393/m.53416 type:complete len:773 (-) Transcript_24393:68-2386(-)|eukprot:CAMPEP_0168221472 /NCGR_PEP_ID=MMETSP0140_2-20121125/9941_1 /TAXON_ID=44445 /ORGANISM="Pseudo-nitzschia australis, Strain 10249 10 AB" /LENGTH=772 /DNA_ID=CAMNT_0008150581 /DNA_START=164 /DNA_END=2482 /DNA_ORIENTATION=+
MGKRSKSKSKTTTKSPVGADADVPIQEERFSAAETRPQFRVPKASASKVVLDDRFSSVLTDPRFQLQQKDKYGRKKKKSDRTAAREELESFYVVEDQEEKNDSDDDDSGDEREKRETTIDNDEAKSESDDAEKSDDEKVEDPRSRIAYLTALSRGELGASSSSEDDDSSQSSDDDDDSDGEDSVYGTAGVLDPSTKLKEEIEMSHDSSPYLVVTLMDWDNIRAIDLFSILSSFAPPGAVKKVQVFESDLGMKQMAKDKLHGPTGIWQKRKIAKQIDTTGEGSSDEEESDSGSDGDHSESAGSREAGINFEEENIPDESDFDPEKLRAYEASKLKYYFAVTEFSQAEYADIVYREVDGMEFEHSSTAIDLRTLPAEAVESVIADRPMRDQATSIPGRYEPPDFIVSALQKTNVQCTWDQGDKEREKKLTNYGTANWHESFEQDDLKAYIASDASSDEDSDDDDDGKADKRSMMRKALGLGSASDDDSGEDDDDGTSGASSSESDDDKGDTMSRQIKIMPGKKDLEERIRSKLEPKENTKELTPWEKYQEKRKQKRKERRQASRGKKPSEDSMKSISKKDTRSKDRDDFFASDDDIDADAKFESAERYKNDKNNSSSKERKAKEELELLMAGEDAEEEERDYDIRGIQRLEKNKGKKLKGSRKRKEAKIAAEVSGSSFKVNVKDERFKAVLDGSDGRFGIDKTDPNFRDTAAMRDILSEQTTRRKNKRQKKANSKESVVPDVDVKHANGGKTSGASALSFLVQKLKTQVDQNKS